MKFKNVLKSAVSLMLCASMVFVQAVPALAEGLEKAEPVEVEGTRLSEEELPEESIVYFGVTSLQVEETETVYRVPVYREGTELPAEDITLHTTDISALYGKDYELVGKGKELGNTGKTLLELVITGEDGEESEQKEYEITVEGDDISSYRSAEVTVKEATPSSAGSYSSSFQNQEKSGKSQLALLKEEQTGAPTRETGSSGLATTLTDALWKQVVPELYSQLTWSCEQKIHFEEGQKEAAVEIRILADNEAEGSENFSVTIVEAESTRPYGAITLSVMINDDEEPVYSVLTLDKESYITENGVAKIKVNRHEALSSLCTVILKGINTATGEETTYGEVVLMPYEESSEVSLNIDEETRICFGEMTAAVTEEASITEAVVFPEEKLGEESENYEIFSAGEDYDVELLSGNQRSFNIKFKESNRTYKVEQEEGKEYGIIYDEGYTPRVRVGVYVMPKWFKYGLYEGYSKPSSRNSEYRVLSNGTPAGFLHWYDRYWDTLGAACATLTTKTEVLKGIYYQVAVPDWEQDKKENSTRCEFILNGKEENRTGQFDRGIYDKSDECLRVETPDYMNFKFRARDTRDGRSPDIHLYFYGVACMFRKFRFQWKSAPEKEFKAGKQGKTNASPLQFSIDYGVRNGDFARDVYADFDSEQTNLVVKTIANNVNGVTDMFGKITGYSLSVTTVTSSGEKERKTLQYPEEFLSWYKKKNKNKNTSGTLYGPGIFIYGPYHGKLNGIGSNNAKGNSAFEKQIRSNPDQMAYDSTFLEWIDSYNIAKVDETGKTYRQEIQVTPIVEYINADVKVLLPKGAKSSADAKGKFASKELAVGTYNQGQFHAGDKLDLSCTTVDDAKYEVIGYEMSTDGGTKFNTITSEMELVLRPNVSYVIRPVIAERSNGIEVVFEKGAEACLALQDAVIPQSELENLPNLKGHTYLNLNPEAKTVQEKMRVIPGKAYTVNVLVTQAPQDAGSVYRPVFTDSMTKTTYNGQSYSFIGRQNREDNVITVRKETVKKTDLKTFKLEGHAVTSMAAIVNDALGKHENPAFGYTAQIGNGQQSVKDRKTKEVIDLVKNVTGTVQEDGSFALNGLNVKSGDRLSVLFTGAEDDSQVFDVKVQSAGNSQNIGKFELSYPYFAPRIISNGLTYSYDMPGNNIKTNLTQNSIMILDDQLKLTAQVDTKGKNITKAVFRSVTVKGAVHEYTALANAENPGIFEVKLPKLTDNFFNGEKLQVYLVEERVIEVGKEKEKRTDEVKYPVVQTGFSFYTTNVKLAPKTFDEEIPLDECKDAMDVPLLGDICGKLQSGKMDLSRTDWPNKQGFSVTCGLNSMVYSNQQLYNNDGKQSWSVFSNFMDSAQKQRDEIASKKELVNVGNMTHMNKIEEELDESNDNSFYTKDLGLEDLNEKEDDKKESDNSLAANKTAPKGDATAKTKLNQDARITVSARFALDWEYIYNSKTEQYMLYSFAITVGGRGNISKTWYTVIVYVPCFLNLSGFGDVNFIGGGIYSDVTQAMSAGEFGNYEGNVREILKDKNAHFICQFDYAAEFKITIGVGMCGVLSARGYVAIGLQAQAGNNPALTENVGFLLNGKGGLGLDVLIGSIDVDVINKVVGWGSLKGQSKTTMWNGINTRPFGALGASADAADTETENALEEVLQEDVPEGSEADGSAGELVFKELENGAVPAESFGTFGDTGLLGATPVPVKEEVLQENAAQYSRPQLLDLGDGRQFLSFIGASEDGNSVLYYSVCSKDGTWSKPERVYGESIQDAQASLLLADNKVYIAWQCAGKAVGKEEALKKRLSAFDLKLAVYDTITGKMSAPEKLTDNEFLPLDPHLSRLGDEIYCSYNLVDYASSEKLEEYTDFKLNYLTPAVTVIRDGKAVPYRTGTKEYLERFVEIEHPSITDPLVTDLQTETLSIKDQEGTEHGLFVSAYTIDEDKDASTDTDKEVYLKVTEQKAGANKAYYPIRITKDSKSDAFPRLTKLGDELYLSWISDTDTFCLLDVKSLLSAFFAPDTGSTAYNNSIRSSFAASSGQNWYKKTAQELGIPETKAEEEEGYCYESSVYSNLTQDEFNIAKKVLKTDGFSDYWLATDGRDLYIFYTDICEEFEDTGEDIYGFRYQRGNADEETYGEEEELRGIGFSNPVRITETGEAYDEISLFMTKDRGISMVSNRYQQKADENTGKVQYKDYKLIYTSFVSEGSVEIEENGLEVSSDLIPGQCSYVYLTLKNSGLYPTEGFHLELTAEKNGVTKEIYSDSIEVEMDSDEYLGIQIPWEVPEDADGTVITAEVTETGVSREVTSTDFVTVETGVNLALYALEASPAEFKEIKVDASVLNAGNTAVSGCTACLVSVNDGEDGSRVETVIETEELEELKPGESADLEFLVDSKKEYYNASGVMKLLLRIMNGETEVDSEITQFYSDKPMVLELNGGKTDLYLKKGETMQISSQAYPWNELAGEVYYAAKDTDIVSITEGGKVTAMKEGTTIVSGYSPSSSIASYVYIHVGDGEDPEEDTGSSMQTYPSWVISSGTWKLGTDGGWTYLLSGNPVKNGWFCIANPYADTKKKQKAYAWFRFDQHGQMQTGWITDTDGNRYYLNPYSDNTKGAMVSGWQQIDGKWYYFSEKEGSGTCGALLKNTVTPDGYRVDKEGVWVQNR